MAVELRCSDCRAKLRLKEAPEAGTEVECPKCGTVFAAPEPEEEAPKESTEKESAEKKEPKAKKKDKAAAGTPKRRRAKKRETSKVALFAVIGAGVFMLLVVG